MDLGLDFSRKEFIVGNIGPDCGMPTEKGFHPPKEITHFMVDKKINADRFFEKYLSNREIDFLEERDSFYLGYYAHLITDEEWIRFNKGKKKQPIYQAILGKPEYTRVIKTDWYVLDFVFLKANQEHIFWHTFQYIDEFPDYLDFFEEGQVSKQVNRITDFYLNNSISDDHEFKYLTMEEVDKFVADTTILLYERLIGRSMR